MYIIPGIQNVPVSNTHSPIMYIIAEINSVYVLPLNHYINNFRATYKPIGDPETGQNELKQ